MKKLLAMVLTVSMTAAMVGCGQAFQHSFYFGLCDAIKQFCTC